MKHLVEKFRNQNIFLKVENDQIKIQYDGDKINPEVFNEIRENKEEIVKYLKQIAANSSFNQIEKVKESASYELSSGQKRIWIVSQFENEKISYNEFVQIPLKGNYHLPFFQKAIEQTIKKHEILRTVFKEDDTGEIKQWIMPAADVSFQLGYKDFRGETNAWELVDLFVKEDLTKAFDLETGPLLRIYFLQIGEDEYVFYCTMYHIISDGWSMEVFAKDTLAFYECYEKGEEPVIEELRIQYKDYAAWQLSQLKGNKSAVHRDFWLKYLSGSLPSLNLPTTKIRPAIKTNNGNRFSTYISEETTDRLKSFTRENSGTLFMSILAGWNVLFHKYSSSKDIIIGTPVAGRDHIDLQDQIGFYVNTVVLRNEVNPSDSFAVFYQKTKDSTMSAFDHQMYPFDELVDDLGIKKDTGRNSVFDVMITLQNIGEKDRNFEIDEEITIRDHGKVNVKFDLDITFFEVGNALFFTIDYNSDVYDGDFIKQLITHYKLLLNEVIQNPKNQIKDLTFLSPDEKYELLESFNSTDVEYPKDKSVVDLFEDQVMKSPDNIAVIFEDVQLTYTELNEKSNQFAHYLSTKYEIRPDELIGIKLNRSEQMIVSILGILKAGGAYVPIDPEYPESRIAFIEKDSNCRLVIDTSEWIEFANRQHEFVSENPVKQYRDEHLAYVIYTSGSTGEPKGVEICHGSLVDYIFTTKNTFELNSDDSIIQQSSISFDISVEEIFSSLVSGSKLVVLKSGAREMEELIEIINRYKITVLSTTPLVIRELNNAADQLSNLRILISGGDVLKEQYVSNLFGKLDLYNTYGPTEATVCATYNRVESLESAGLIGKPIANHRIRIVSDENTLQPIGVAGEICIAGAGLARGYLNKSGLTSEKFIASSFVEGERLYKTGDLGRWLADGTIEYLGRKDDQVKIRGYRIELGEIEAKLSEKSDLVQVAVLAEGGSDGEKELVAFVVSDVEQTAADLRLFLASRIPSYMIPVHFVQLDAFPLTGNGKIDKNALVSKTAEKRLSSGVEYIAPRNEMEQKVLQVWSEVLMKEQKEISINDNFFDIGGTSIKVIKVLSRINNSFNKTLKVISLFEHTTISSFVEFMRSQDEYKSDVNHSAENDPDQIVHTRTIQNNDIAIIGVSGKFPKSDDISEFWTNLVNGKELTHFYTPDELSESGLNRADDPNFIAVDALINNSESFDYSFFGYTREEAMLMDPQIRVVHEQVWSALEDANCPDTEKEKIGLFLSASDNLNWRAFAMMQDEDENVNPFYGELISNKNFISTLISYSLNLTGPSNYIDTACSSSLYSVHLACSSLLIGESTVALAGGASISSSTNRGYNYREGMIFSKDGYCKAFDAEASGTISGEGVGLVVLKRLDDALRDKDHIYAVIKSSAVNNDGRNKIGFTAPSVSGQVDCIVSAHRKAGINPSAIGYIETHGTGTKLGDPIEIEALNKAFNYDKEHSCKIGSVKTNMGHLDAAAGVAGLIKTALTLKHRLIPPTLHYNKPNPEINFESGPFSVNQELKAWDGDKPFLAGVSSFGIGGTNVHVILEEMKPKLKPTPSKPYKLVTYSAKTEASLERYEQKLIDFLEKNPNTDIADLSYSLSVGRKGFSHRKFIVGSDYCDILDQLKQKKLKSFDLSVSNEKKSVVFMFPGQGSQYFSMAKDLYESDSFFKGIMDEGFELLKTLTDYDYKEIIGYTGSGDKNLINNTLFTQPLLFLIEYAYARLLVKSDVKPTYMIGHSLGEYVAACISGVFSFHDGLSIVVFRAQLMSEMEEGMMIGIGASADEISLLLNKDLSIAAINTDETCVISGKVESVKSLIDKLTEKGIPFSVLKTSHAFHSGMMDPILDRFERKMNEIKLSVPKDPFVSNLSGTFITDKEAVSPKYWGSHLRSTVRFSDGLNHLLNQGEAVFIEIGPGKTLSSFLKQHQKFSPGNVSIRLIRGYNEPGNDTQKWVSSLGQLWSNGMNINWESFYQDEIRLKIPLPTYSFERTTLPARVNPFANVTISNTTGLENQNPDEIRPVPDVTLDRSQITNAYVEPQTEMEKSVLQLFVHFFNVDNLGVEDDFFELGGDSLKAMTLINRINKEYNVTITLQEFFENETISRLSKIIEDKKNSTHFEETDNSILI